MAAFNTFLSCIQSRSNCGIFSFAYIRKLLMVDLYIHVLSACSGHYRILDIIYSVYLGAYDEEEAAARAYDLAALKYWGPGTLINFPVSDYARDIDEMQNISREEYLASLRRKSSGFSRGMSKCRARVSQKNRWDVRFDQSIGNEYLNVGNYWDDSATAYDMSQGDNRKFSMVTSIDLSAYVKWWQPKKFHQDLTPKHVEESHSLSDQRSVNVEEPETPECPGKSCDPYQLPSLGVSHGKLHKPSRTSALSILFKSPLFKQMIQKESAKKSASGQDKTPCYDLGKIGLQQVQKNQINPEEHQIGCKESAHGSGCFRPSVQITSITQVPSVSTTLECKTMHSHLQNIEGT
ncbi:AP2-like ethylene-responsive transcription factor At2g41710 [Cryptomeria japonica]|uniref:AP2-like ethylene-responsive transcription factor At2g41710 n=1 Tax=Cryptomeria japonica TaxID=3369 RepID=UPI0025AD3EA0|nr:AP2-like ethylene-responsive transcription factor At2g41710 [Cryptomeria japonica]